MATQVESIKWIPGTRFMVDGFAFANARCVHYFLTHMHSDHTVGLAKGFDAGVVYCSPPTARLLAIDFGLRRDAIRPLEVGVRHVVEGVGVTLLDANHCPGAVMFLFEVPKADASQPPTVILHTGDMRWRPGLAAQPPLAALLQRRLGGGEGSAGGGGARSAPPSSSSSGSSSGIGGAGVDVLFLDTTYCLPRYAFPPQDAAIATIVRLCRRHAEAEPRTLFVVGSYHIGKERAFLGAAAALGWRVWAPPAKRRVLGLLGLPEAQSTLLADDESDGQIHAIFMGKELQPDALRERMARGGYRAVVAFRPTGWAFRSSSSSNGGGGGSNGGNGGGSNGNGNGGNGSSGGNGGGSDGGNGGSEGGEGGEGGGSPDESGYSAARFGDGVTVYGVPYSEHSSFPELRDCVARLRPARIVPTVNAATPAAAAAIVDRFADLMDLSRDRSRLDMYLRKPPRLPPPQAPQGEGGPCGEEKQRQQHEEQDEQQQEEEEEMALEGCGGPSSRGGSWEEDPGTEAPAKRPRVIPAGARGAAAEAGTAATAAAARWDGGSRSPGGSTIQGSVEQEEEEQQQHTAPTPAHAAAEAFNLEAVDVAQQIAIMEQLAREQQQQQRARSSSSSCKQRKQASLHSFFRPAA